MSMYDWNHDGKKDGVDNFIEYQIYDDITKNSGSNNYSKPSKGGMSTFGAILCVIGGLVLTAMLFMETDIDEVPTIVLLLVWFFASFVLGLVVSAFRR